MIASTLVVQREKDFIMKEHITENAGTCAVCNSENIDYSNSEIDNGQMVYDYTCLDCKNSGKEYYALEYIETIAFTED